jgi:hypothetical protein
MAHYEKIRGNSLQTFLNEKWLGLQEDGLYYGGVISARTLETDVLKSPRILNRLYAASL